MEWKNEALGKQGAEIFVERVLGDRGIKIINNSDIVFNEIKMICFKAKNNLDTTVKRDSEKPQVKGVSTQMKLHKPNLEITEPNLEETEQTQEPLEIAETINSTNVEH